MDRCNADPRVRILYLAPALIKRHADILSLGRKYPIRRPFTPKSPKPLISRVLPGRNRMLAAVARKFASDSPEIRVTSYHGPGAISRFKPLIWRDLAGKRDW